MYRYISSNHGDIKPVFFPIGYVFFSIFAFLFSGKAGALANRLCFSKMAWQQTFCFTNLIVNMTNFDDIRPFTDDEIPAAMQRIANNEVLPMVLSYLDNTLDVEMIKQNICQIKTINEFQINITKWIADILVKRTTDSTSISGLENIEKGQSYLFVSNHRDIALDAMFFQQLLYENGYALCQTAFGSNLMCHPLVNDFVKANKMFQLERGGSKIEFYNSLMHVSEYIRHVITETKDSVWIAQRNGRTKDGLDATDPAIIKMFGMSRRDDRIASLAELHIVPVTVSYEWEPCDQLKTLELYASRNAKYEKKPGEDLNSILTGIKQPKGKVHFHISPMIGEADLMALKGCPSGLFYQHIATLADQRINSHYQLTPNNFIAHDLRSGSAQFAQAYSNDQKKCFLQHIAWIDSYKDIDRNVMKDILLGIYANPVDSHSEACSKTNS